MKDGLIPREWKTSIMVPIFKRGSKKDPSNYRGITLLSSVTKILAEKITNKSDIICEEQQGFWHNRST